MEIIEELLTGDSWKLWQATLNRKAPATKRIYLRHFTNFLKAIEMESEHFYDAYTNAKGRETIILQSMVMDRVRELEDGGFSTSASHQTIKSVSSFLRSNGLVFSSDEKHKRHSQGARIIEKNEIRLLLEKTTTYRNMAIILALRDSGLRVSDLSQFTWGHLSECLRRRAEFCIFTLVQQKTNRETKVCLGYESLEYIRKWIDEREKSGEKLTPETPLWVTLNSRPDVGVRVGDKLSHYSISSRIRAIALKAGLMGVSAHSLRKFFITRMMLDGMHESLVKILVGKILGESTGPYIHYSDQQLLDEYKTHYKAISFETTSREEIENLNRRVLELEESLEALKMDPSLAEPYDERGDKWARQLKKAYE